MQAKDAFYLTFGLVFAALFFFGVAYAALVNYLEKQKVQSQTALLVMGGVTVTVIMSGALTGWEHAIYVLMCFAASGTPMVVEYVMREHVRLQADFNRAKELALTWLDAKEDSNDD